MNHIEHDSPTAPTHERRPTCLVVFESMFGNTERIARAIASGLVDEFDVEVLPVGDAPTRITDVDLLVVGAPTHAFGLSRPQTRADAVAKGAPSDGSGGDGWREWLDRLGRPPSPIVAAEFDTRIKPPRPPGSAAHAIRRRLRRLGFDVGGAPVSFSVDGTSGPLIEGEILRAQHWGSGLAAASVRRTRLAGRAHA
jgi:Flavodoxin